MANVSKSNEELRREHRVERQRQQKRRRTIFYFTLCVIVLAIGIALSLTVFFNVKKVVVEGNSMYSDSEIISASGVTSGENMFLMDKDAVRTNITEKLPFVGKVELSNKFPDKLVITVTDTSIKCAVEYNSEYVLIDEDGKVLGTAGKLSDVYENGVKLGEESTTKTQENTTKTKENTTKTQENTTKTKEDTTKTQENTTKTPENTTKVQETTKRAQYVLGDEKIIILKGVAVKSAVPGKIIEVKNEKVFELYEQIMDCLVDNEIKGITELNLTDTVKIQMKYQDRIDIVVGSVSNLENKIKLAKKVLKNQDEINPYQEGTVDLTLDKKAYFSPKQETTKPASTEPVTTESLEKTTKESNTKTNSTSSTGKVDSTVSTSKKSN
ncbi:MAG: FtsQ-type POTRA domain-containing protein [Oscillospiraceae bacterium]|nr:FtsQ-type POTRA domain-containing protein [Oscillospiraceae bacterium]